MMSGRVRMMMVLLQVQILQRNCIRRCLVQMIKIAAIQRNVRTTKAIIRISRIICVEEKNRLEKNHF